MCLIHSSYLFYTTSLSRFSIPSTLDFCLCSCVAVSWVRWQEKNIKIKISDVTGKNLEQHNLVSFPRYSLKISHPQWNLDKPQSGGCPPRFPFLITFTLAHPPIEVFSVLVLQPFYFFWDLPLSYWLFSQKLRLNRSLVCTSASGEVLFLFPRSATPGLHCFE